MELNAHNLQTVGRFLDSNAIPVADRAVLYVINDTYYRIDEDGCWYFTDEPANMGWALCETPPGLQEIS